MTHTTLISPEQLVSLLGIPSLAIVDCRFSLADTGAGAAAYAVSHVPGAVYAHLDDDLSGPVIPGHSSRHPLPDDAWMAERLGRMGIGDGVQVVVYDDSGGAIAARLWWHLRFLGHEAVAVLDGGWSAWTAADHPVVTSGPESQQARTFTPNKRTNRLVTADDVLSLLENKALGERLALLDARAADRYAGRNETLDPVAGHIAGATSAPFPGNFGPDGRVLSPDVLRKRFEALLQGVDPAEAVVYCGSGVTAAHNVLAICHAGLPEPRLYAGSWSEWITDESRPILTGVQDAEPPADLGIG